MDIKIESNLELDPQNISDQEKGTQKKEGQFDDFLKKEQEEAREEFKDLIERVSSGYENLPEKMREDFVIHNQEILEET